VIEAQGEIVDADVKNHDLLATVSRAKAVLNVTIVDLEKIAHPVKIEHRAKTVGHVKNALSGLHERQREQNVQLAALLHAIAVKAPRLLVTAVTHVHLASLLSSQISRPGKKRSVLCRSELRQKIMLAAQKIAVAVDAMAVAADVLVGDSLPRCRLIGFFNLKQA
jgi:uncharacterized paraquat-inducible protein A